MLPDHFFLLLLHYRLYLLLGLDVITFNLNFCIYDPVNQLETQWCVFTNFVLCHSWNDWIILQNESWIIIWKREKIISCRNNLISWNQFYEKYREINFILEVVFIKLISGKKFVKSIFHSILPDNATFPRWIMSERQWHIQ